MSAIYAVICILVRLVISLNGRAIFTNYRAPVRHITRSNVNVPVPFYLTFEKILITDSISCHIYI